MNKKLSLSIICCLIACCLLWSNIVNGKNFEWATMTTDDMAAAVKVSQSGFVYTAGKQLKKYDNTGNVVWSRDLGNAQTYANDITIKDGFIYVTGTFRDTAHFNPGNAAFTVIPQSSFSDVFVAKFDTLSNPVWVRSFGGNRDDYGNGVEVNAGGDVFLTGSVLSRTDFKIDFNPSTAAADTFFYNTTVNNAIIGYVLKLNSSGVFQWVKTFSGTVNVLAQALAVEQNTGNIVLTGRYTGTADFDPSPTVTNNFTSNGSFDVFLVKLNPTGDLIWAKTFGNNVEERVNDLVLDSLNNVYITGAYRNTVDFDPGTGPGEVFQMTAGTMGSYDMYVLKLSAAGTFAYAKSIGSDFYDDEGFNMAVDRQGKLYVTGSFRGTDVDFDPGPGTFLLSTNVGQDPFILELTLAGDFVWAGDLRGGAIYNFGKAIATDGYKNVYSIGNFNNTVDFDPGNAIYNMTATASNQGFLLKLTCNAKAYDTLVACDSISVNGATFTATGNYVQTLSAVNGCDSVVYLNITINHSVTHNLSVTSCESYTIDGMVYYETSGLYNVVLSTASGCDSIVALDLTIGKFTDTLVLDHCGPYTYNNENYTASGTYTIDLGTTITGCDSIRVLELTINPTPDIAVTRSGNTLIAQAPAATYQWIRCPGNDPVAGATGQSFSPATNGSYAVVVTKADCSDTSACYDITGLTSVRDLDLYKNLNLYPNPATYTLSISSTYDKTINQLAVFNALGQQVIHYNDVKSKTFSVPTANLAPGMYIVELIFADGIRAKLPFSKK